MMRVLFLLIFLSSGISLLHAQRQETVFGHNSLDMTGFWYSNTNNFSFFEEDSEYFSGGNIGFEFNKSLILGWAWQRLSGVGTLPGSGGESFDMKHDGLMIGYVPASHKVIHPYISVMGGSGRLDYKGDRERIFVVEPAVGLEINLFSWWHLGGEAGYRLVGDVDAVGVDGTDFSSPFLQLQFRFGFSNRWR